MRHEEPASVRLCLGPLVTKKSPVVPVEVSSIVTRIPGRSILIISPKTSKINAQSDILRCSFFFPTSSNLISNGKGKDLLVRRLKSAKCLWKWCLSEGRRARSRPVDFVSKRDADLKIWRGNPAESNLG